MTVLDFNADKGLYAFQVQNLETGLHSHPALEIVLAQSGQFTLRTRQASYPSLSVAIIDANLPHQLIAPECQLQLVMIEYDLPFTRQVLRQHQLPLVNGYCCQSGTTSAGEMLPGLLQQLEERTPLTAYDPRVHMAIRYMNTYVLTYDSLIPTLQTITHLSSSRLSHLFKQHTGLSLKKYLVWSRLKATIQQHLHQSEDLFTSLIQSGFYDQPHFSKAFKNLLGVKPSAAYNSRTVQV